VAGIQNPMQGGIVQGFLSLKVFSMAEAIVWRIRQKKAVGMLLGGIFEENNFPQIQVLTKNVIKSWGKL
jgi:hypothetical protein